jgi:peptide/nickel transport system substrate-binding protein
MRERNYWLRKATSSRLSRRRFVGGAAATGVGAAGLALVGCGGDDDDDDGDPTSAPAEDTATTAPGEPTATSAPADTPTPEDTSGRQVGGKARFTSANNTFDTFDTDRSRFTPFAVIIAQTNQAIVHYRDFNTAELEAAFAESWEQPDDTTYIFKRRPQKWMDKAPVNGRETTADDMAQFILRNQAGQLLDGTEDPNFYRKDLYQGINVEVPDDDTMRLTFDEPSPFFLSATLAGSYAKVQAPEAIEAFEGTYADLRTELMIGTGPFDLTQFDADGNIEFSRNDNFYDTPLLDGTEYFPLFTDAAALQAAFEQKQIDEFGPRTLDIRDDLMNRYDGQIWIDRIFSGNPMAGTYYGGALPWSDLRLIGAVFKSIDRRLMVQQLFQGSGAITGNIPPTQAAFAIPESELITFEGYKEDHEAELAEAKQMWEAAGGPDLGPIKLDIPDIWEGAYQGISESIVTMLKSNLGNDVEVTLEPYSTITGKLIEQKYGNGDLSIWFGWISEVQAPEPTAGLFASFNSEGSGFFQFGVQNDKIDALTSAAMTDLNIESRVESAKDVERELLRLYGAGVPYNVIQIGNTLRWNYYHSENQTSFIDSHNGWRDTWLDKTDPTFEGRKA